MQYDNLHDLVYKSSSSRRYFLSMSVDMQINLTKFKDNIHTADQLHKTVDLLEKNNRAIEISNSLDYLFRRKE